MVESFLEDLRRADGSSDEGSEKYYSPLTSPSSVGAARNPSPENILDYLDGLEPITDNNCCQSVRLQELTIRARSKPKELIHQQLSEYLVDVLLPKTSMLRRRRTPAACLLTRRQIRKKEYTKDLEKI